VAHKFNLGRRAGLLLPLSSVRGNAGDLGSYADAGRIADWLLTAGCTLWQLLPLNEVSPGQDSPYSASSSFALEPVYIDLNGVPDLDALAPDEQAELARLRRDPRVHFARYRNVKRGALARAFRRFQHRERGTDRERAFQQFRREHAGWIEDWALYRALHEERQKSWRDWEPPLRDREPDALDRARARLREPIDELCYVQWIADAQWRAGRREANAKGVKVLGDLPFMVAEDSADVWGFQRFFRFDATVGVPPDAYSKDGQDWGLPVPRWEEMREAGDPWLHQRAERAAELYDAFRVDHVVGLYRTYARPIDKRTPFFIPADESRQREQGERILALLGEKAEVLAEDLGTVPDFVRASLAAQDYPLPARLRRRDGDARYRVAADLVGRPRGLGARAPAHAAAARAAARPGPEALHSRDPQGAARVGVRRLERCIAHADHRCAGLEGSVEHARHRRRPQLDLPAAVDDPRAFFRARTRGNGAGACTSCREIRPQAVTGTCARRPAR
jgi:4-alpha-glucanotransferase